MSSAFGHRGSRRTWRVSLALIGALLFLFMLLPIVGLVSNTGIGNLVAGLTHPVVAPALVLSLVTTTVSLAVVVLTGTPLAWVLARTRHPFARFVESCVDLPVVLPPAVAGLGLLLVFGRRSPLGGWLDAHGVSIAFTTSAVVLAQIFVSAPFFVHAATAAFRRLDEDLVVIARTLGAPPWRVFVRIALPLALPSLISGAALSFARSLGEFGATLMFAGSLAGKTQTLPLAIYAAMEQDLRAAQALSIVLVIVAFFLLLVVRASARPSVEDEPSRGPSCSV